MYGRVDRAAEGMAWAAFVVGLFRGPGRRFSAPPGIARRSGTRAEETGRDTLRVTG